MLCVSADDVAWIIIVTLSDEFHLSLLHFVIKIHIHRHTHKRADNEQNMKVNGGAL